MRLMHNLMFCCIIVIYWRKHFLWYIDANISFCAVYHIEHFAKILKSNYHPVKLPNFLLVFLKHLIIVQVHNCNEICSSELKWINLALLKEMWHICVQLIILKTGKRMSDYGLKGVIVASVTLIIWLKTILHRSSVRAALIIWFKSILH